jgi:hypothetical protein
LLSNQYFLLMKYLYIQCLPAIHVCSFLTCF